jgi:peptide/nickel transport system substrate-binding protein
MEQGNFMAQDIKTSRRSVTKGFAAALIATPFGMMTKGAWAQARKAGTLTTLITPEPPIIIPGVNNQGPTLIVGCKVFEGLLTYSQKVEPMPGLAKSFSLASDGLTYTFNLQTGVTWHDGKPFTADDVVFSIMKFHMELSPRSRAIFQRIETCVAKDAATVEIKLKAPFEPFLLMFDATTCAIMAKHIYDGTDAAGMRNNPANQAPIGTGPFKLAEWQRGNFIRLVKNDKYWKPGQPKLDELIYRIIPDSNLRGVALQTGQVQLTAFNDIEAFDVPRYKSDANLEVNLGGWEYFGPLSWIELNHRAKPLDNPKVRRALSMLIDRNFIVNRLWFGVGKAATSPISSATKFHDASIKLPAFDEKAAAALLDEAGLKVGADGTRFELKFMPLPYGEIWNRLGEYVRQQFAKVGIKLVAEAVDAGTWARKLGQWEYDVTINFVYQWGDPTLGVERTYVSTNIQKVPFTNTAGYSNPKVDELFKVARESGNQAARAAAFSDVQKVLVEDMPLIWLMELSFPTIHDKKLKGVVSGATGVHGNFGDVSFG